MKYFLQKQYGCKPIQTMYHVFLYFFGFLVKASQNVICNDNNVKINGNCSNQLNSSVHAPPIAFIEDI